MKKLILMTLALLLAPLPALSQEAPRSETRAPANLDKNTNRDQQGGTSRFDFRSRMGDAIEAVLLCAAPFPEDFVQSQGRLLQASLHPCQNG